MKLSILATMLGSAAAFAPSQLGNKATQLASFYDDDIGRASESLGMFDPLNLVKDDEETFNRLRSVELKNGRVAMAAFLGYIVTWGHPDVRFPGCESFPAGHEAVLTIPPVELLAPILLICAPLELAVFKQKEGSWPGDMSGGDVVPVGFGPYAKTEEDEIRLRTNELLNGRAAMMGWLALLFHEQIDGKPFIFFDKAF